MEVAMLTGVLTSKDSFFWAGGITFILDLLPYLSRKFEITLYAAGKRKERFEIGSVEVNIVPGIKIPKIEKALLPPLHITPDVMLFLEYSAPLSRNSGKRNLCIFHHLAQPFMNENPEAFRRYFGISGLAFARLENFVLRRVKRKVEMALLVSPVTERYLRQAGFDTLIVGNGIEVKRYRKKRKENFAIYIGRLVNYKRVEMAMELAKRVGIPLKVVGKGPMREELEKRAGENVEFLGYVDEEEKVELLSKAKYLFNFSAFEGFNLTLVEAMASGAIPVVSRNRAHEFVFSGRKVGILAGNLEEAERGVKTLEEEKRLRERMVREGRKLVEEKWNAKKIAREYERIIEGKI